MYECRARPLRAPALARYSHIPVLRDGFAFWPGAPQDGDITEYRKPVGEGRHDHDWRPPGFWVLLGRDRAVERAMNDKITELETRIAFQDGTIQQLNDVVVRQQGEIDRLARELESLRTQV